MRKARLRCLALVALCSSMSFGSTAQAASSQTADAKHYYLVVWLHNGETVEFDTLNFPVVDYTGSEVKVKCGTTQLEYKIEDIRKYMLLNERELEESSVEKVSISNEAKMEKDGSSFYFSGCTPGSNIMVYSMNGTMERNTKANTDGEAELSVFGMNKGVYIIKTEKTTYKIIINE